MFLYNSENEWKIFYKYLNYLELNSEDLINIFIENLNGFTNILIVFIQHFNCGYKIVWQLKVEITALIIKI